MERGRSGSRRDLEKNAKGRAARRRTIKHPPPLGGAPETVPVLRALLKTLAALADPERAATHAWFFKTGKGQYGEGDRFLGIRVPLLRKTALLYRSLDIANIERLLASPIHEHRFVALVILVARYEEGSAEDRAKIFDFYLAHTVRINSWDLVDTSAPYIIGDYLLQRPRDILARLARSPILWERRIAIVSTLTFVKQGQTEDAFRLAEVLLADGHDLMHKATGWVLRETGKVSRPDLLRFLKTHYASVPRTTLRYAIEHFSPAQRKRLLAGEF